MKRRYFASGFLMISFLCSVFTIGCSSTPDPAPSDPEAVLSGTDEQIFVGDSIEMNYDPNVIMKRAEAYFEKESFLEAIVEYKHFLDLHRNHMLAPYAQYKIAMSHYKRFRTIDRDPEPIQESMTAFRKLLSEFPDSQHETEALEKIKSCQEHLAQHDLFVGEFYYKRQSYLAAAHRFKNIVENYPQLETAGEAMYHLAETYEQLGDAEWAKDWLVQLVQEHKDNSFYQPGMQMLTKLQEDYPDLEVPNMENHHEDAIKLAKIQPDLSLLQTHFLPPSEENALVPAQPAQCSLGSWCESSPYIPSPQAPHSSSATETCRPGQWC